LQHSKHAISSIAQQQHKHAKLEKKNFIEIQIDLLSYQSKQGPPPRNPLGKFSRDGKPFSLFIVSILNKN